MPLQPLDAGLIASAAIGQARVDQMPVDDLLGQPRDSSPDLGAWERQSDDGLFSDGFEN